MPRGLAGQKYTVSAHCRWQLADPAWRECVAEVSELINAPPRIATGKLLKHANRRLVFSHLDPVTNECVVVKAFPLQGVKRQLLKHRKYAQAEATHLKRAHTMGLPVPAPYAFGYQGFLLKRWTAVIMEQVAGRDFLTALRIATTRDDEQQVLNRCAELLLNLFQAGVNHIDLKPDALFFGECSSEDRIIDFQYCNFGSPNLKTAMAQAGHFAYWWMQEDTEAEDMIQEWARVLIAKLCPEKSEQETAYNWFNQHRQSVMSIAQRLRQ